MGASIDSRHYTLEDQRRFAELSGDWNPMHLDPQVTRRELFGEVVVHGVHGLLRALEAWLAQPGALAGAGIGRLAVRFPSPILLGQTVETRVVEESDARVRLQTRHGRRSVLEVTLERAPLPGAAQGPAPLPPPARPETAPRDPAFAELAGQRGNLPLHAAPVALARAFPNLAARLPAATVAELLALTRLVGMQCPGLHSVFSSFDALLRPQPGPRPELAWQVERVDPRVSLVRIAFEGPTLRGRIEAFRRPEPQAQPGIDAVRERVRAGEFEGQVALIVGGSRGLGEVTARLLAAGGGHPVVTWRSGRAEAKELVREIRHAGLRCDAIACDVAKPEPAVAQLAALGAAPTHLYYFASPKIFVNKAELFEPALFRSFLDCYVDHFHATLRALRDTFPTPLVVFYPSSTALDEPVKNLAEYGAAKAAGEALCAHLDRFERDLRVHVRRLPRIATDQTLTLIPYPAASALDVMLEIARELCSA